MVFDTLFAKTRYELFFFFQLSVHLQVIFIFLYKVENKSQRIALHFLFVIRKNNVSVLQEKTHRDDLRTEEIIRLSLFPFPLV